MLNSNTSRMRFKKAFQEAITEILFVLAIVSAMPLSIQPVKALEQPGNSCTDCHVKLTPEAHRQFVEMRSMHLGMGVSCSTACHEDRFNKPTANTYGLWSISMHALFNATCEKCHNGNPSVFSKEEAHAGLSNTRTACNNTHETCGKCHESELDEFINSEHFKKQSGGKPAPTCLTCHQAHSVRELTPSEREEFCTSCHASFNEACEKCHVNQLAVSRQEAHLYLSNISIVRANNPETCGECHKPELTEFKSSPLFKKLESGEVHVPTCTVCHQAHIMRILTSSEREAFCSNCHNNMTGIDSAVLKKANEALSFAGELQAEISKAEGAVVSAKAEGKDVKEAEMYLESARTILNDVPDAWHRFNLTYFETEVLQGIAEAQKAEKKAAESAKTPGFEVVLMMSGLTAAYFLKRGLP